MARGVDDPAVTAFIEKMQADEAKRIIHSF